MNLAESIAAILAMHEGRMLRARVALLELAEELETSSPRGRPDLAEPSERIRAIARELAPPTRDPGACPDHTAAETLEVISCVVCGAWKPSKESPLVYIGSDGVHRAVRNSPTPPAPPPAPDSDRGFAFVGDALDSPPRPFTEEWYAQTRNETHRALRESGMLDAIKAAASSHQATRAIERGDFGAVPRDALLRTVQKYDPSIRVPSAPNAPFFADLREADACPKCDGHRWQLNADGSSSNCDLCRPVEKASFPVQEIPGDAAAENKAAATPASPPLSDQQCECREKDHGKRCPMPATHRISKLGGYFFYCADCTAFRVPHAERIDGSGVVDELDYRRPCPNHDEPAR